MRTFDFSPLYRTSIGFDRVAGLLDSLVNTEQTQPAYPPYNIELTGEDKYRITMAVAGFDQNDLAIEVEQNTLKVNGKKAAAEGERHYLHQGIAERNFERRFQLADHVKVVGAEHQNGLLHIDLVREIPEVMKPRTIEISSGNRLISDAAKPQTTADETEKADTKSAA